MSEDIRWEVILDRRSNPQPSPSIYGGGDCGFCALGGIMNISTEEAYDTYSEDGKREPMSWMGIRQAFWNAKAEDKVSDFLDSTPLWPGDFYEGQAQFGHPSWQQNLSWVKYVKMGLQAGYYGMMSMDYAGEGKFTTDHWVVCCGMRMRAVPHDNVEGATSLHYDLLVSCSASNPKGYWEDHLKFLREKGGYNILLVKPTEK